MASAPPFAWAHLGPVAIGGALGTALRAALLLIDAPGWQAFAVPAINVAGALLLGVITGWSLRFASTERALRFRLFLGAGAMGGFTTYSTFAVQAASPETLGITLATIVVGTLAGWLGLVIARPGHGDSAEGPGGPVSAIDPGGAG